MEKGQRGSHFLVPLLLLELWNFFFWVSVFFRQINTFSYEKSYPLVAYIYCLFIFCPVLDNSATVVIDGKEL